MNNLVEALVLSCTNALVDSFVHRALGGQSAKRPVCTTRYERPVL